MNLRSLLIVSLAALALVACSSTEKKSKSNDGNLCEPAATEVPECTGSESRFQVMAKINIAEANDDGSVPGFDLDCRSDASCKCKTEDGPDGGTVSTCEDYTSPTGAAGIDNQFSRLAPDLDTIFNIGDKIQENIEEGDLIILLEMQNLDAATIDSTTNDECVTLEVYLGFIPNGGEPLLANGGLAPEQTFDLDNRSFDGNTAKIRFGGKITNGKLEAGPATIPLSLPVGSSEIELNIQDGRLTATFDGDRLKDGLIGGVLDIEELVASVEAIEDYATLGTTLRPILKKFADMNAAGDDNLCSAVSLGIEYETVVALRGEKGDKPPKADASVEEDDAGTDAN